MKLHCRLLLMLVTLAPLSVLAEQAGRGEDQAAEQPVQQEQQSKERPQDQGSYIPFKPKEKVDADASIPFPADI